MVANKKTYLNGFTIVELLVVIVIISILATITIISYTGISSKATQTAIISDLDNASKQLKLFQVENSGYPNSITDCAGSTPAAGNLCIKKSGSNVITSYVQDNTINPQGFCINITNGNYSYKITSTTYNTPILGDCSTPSPVVVTYSNPGSSTFTVPSGVTSIQVEAWGAQGVAGGNMGYATGGAGGNGGYAKGDLSVTSGQLVYSFVGGVGGGGSGSGNFGNSGSGGAGGGASDVRYGGNALSNRKIVAGGGGGGSGGYDDGATEWYDGGTGGNGGGLSGTAGYGVAGTQTTGYALGQAGPGSQGGGGGGNGYYGGTAGGGGSGYIGGVTNGTTSAGVKSGNGQVKLTYTFMVY